VNDIEFPPALSPVQMQRIRCEPVVGEVERAIGDLGKGRKGRENEEDGRENGKPARGGLYKLAAEYVRMSPL
jgi:hypothetical protein